MSDPMVEPKAATMQLLGIPAERTVTVNEDAGWLRQDPEREQEWLRQLSLIYGGLILVGVYMVQPFLTAASPDLSAKVCVVAFAVAMPLLAALVLLNRQEAFRRRATTSVLAVIARVVAQNCAFVGVVAGFWRIHWIAGVGMLASGLVGVAVYSAGYTRLEQLRSLRSRKAKNRRHRGIAPSRVSARCGWAAPGQPLRRSHQR
jgi:hypothetical protein